jgi:membrane-associated phospholipid phosphatase
MSESLVDPRCPCQGAQINFIDRLSYTAVTLGARHHQTAWPWVVTGLAGGAVATAMVLAGSHFPTDVMMGALAGTAVGVSIPVLHLRSSRRLRLSLARQPGGASLLLVGRF